MLVNEFLSDDAKALVLLSLSLSSDKGIKVLSEVEYSNLELVLKKYFLKPSALYDNDTLIAMASESELEYSRLRELLSRDLELTIELNNLNEQGVWLVTNLDSEYPSKIKKKMKAHMPRFFFGVGKIELLSRGGLSIMASQTAGKAAFKYSQELAVRAAKENCMIITGGSRGIEAEVITNVLENNGSAISVVPDTLLLRSLEPLCQNAIIEERFTIISPYHPRSVFASNKLKNRNGAIYSLSDYSLIISSDYKKGGTWSGAVTELKKKKPIPIFAYSSELENTGNKALMKLGARPWPELNNNRTILSQLSEIVNPSKTKDELFDMAELF